MKFLFSFLLLVSLSTLQTCYNSSDYDHFIHDDMGSPRGDFSPEYSDVDFSDMNDPIERPQMLPNIAVYQQVKDRGDFLVICRFTDQVHGIPPELSVESEHDYTKDLMGCMRGVECLFKVTVSPPASFTCVHLIGFNEYIQYLQSETYNLESDHEKGVSVFYICFVSIIAVCLMIMITAVIVITIMSNSKEPIMTATNNDYEDGIYDLAVL